MRSWRLASLLVRPLLRPTRPVRAKWPKGQVEILLWRSGSSFWRGRSGRWLSERVHRASAHIGLQAAST